MKKSALVTALTLLAFFVNAQVITDKTSKNVSVSFDVLNDFVTKSPANAKFRVINQGFNVNATYNFKVGEGSHIFALGTGLRIHNWYSDSRITNIKADTIAFAPINSKLNFNRSKLNLVYLDFPAEFRFRFDDKWKIGIGFKMGVLIDSKEKYVGQLVENGPTMHIKHKKVNSLERYTFGPTLRFGWKYINAYAFYQVSRTFQRDLGPEMYPLSVGITIAPF